MKPHHDFHSKPSHFLAARPVQTLESSTRTAWFRAWTHARFVFTHLFGYNTVAQRAWAAQAGLGTLALLGRGGGTSWRSRQDCPPLPARWAPQQPALPSTPFPQPSPCFSSTDMAEQLLMVKLRAVFHLLGEAGSRPSRSNPRKSIFLYINLT